MRSRNELANWFRMARETGRISISAVKLETCALCCSPLAENDETDLDERGLHHRNPYVCIEALQEQQRALEKYLDASREMVIRLQHKRQLRPPKKVAKARKQP